MLQTLLLFYEPEQTKLIFPWKFSKASCVCCMLSLSLSLSLCLFVSLSLSLYTYIGPPRPRYNDGPPTCTSRLGRWPPDPAVAGRRPLPADRRPGADSGGDHGGEADPLPAAAADAPASLSLRPRDMSCRRAWSRPPGDRSESSPAGGGAAAAGGGATAGWGAAAGGGGAAAAAAEEAPWRASSARASACSRQ